MNNISKVKPLWVSQTQKNKKDSSTSKTHLQPFCNGLDDLYSNKHPQLPTAVAQTPYSPIVLLHLLTDPPINFKQFVDVKQNVVWSVHEIETHTLIPTVSLGTQRIAKLTVYGSIVYQHGRTMLSPRKIVPSKSFYRLVKINLET